MRAAGSILVAAVVLVATAAPADEPTAHPWISIEGRHWQIAKAADEDAAATDATELTRGACPTGTLEVAGEAKVDGASSIELLQETVCTDWIRREFPQRCGVFDEAAWAKLATALPTRPMHFCIDRFEYPNLRGAYPIIFVTWYEAKALCARSPRIPRA
mgnify:FL=1